MLRGALSNETKTVIFFFVREQVHVKTYCKDIFKNIKQKHKNNGFKNNSKKLGLPVILILLLLFTLFGIKQRFSLQL